MIRQCTISSTDVKAVQKPDGSWTVEGVEAEQFIDTILISDRMGKPFNSTFHVTLYADECLQRLIKNESDFSNLFIPSHTVSPYYHAPEVVFSGKNQFIAGYFTSEPPQPGEDKATVFTNVELLEPEVYMWSLIFLVSISFIVAIRILAHLRARGRPRRGRTPLPRVILRHIGDVFYHSNDQFKLISFLYAVFCFYIVTTFLCIYKTSHVIADRPFYPTSYQESLDYKTSLLVFYDQFVVVSEDFQLAPSGSLKRKLWDKLMASGSREKYLINHENTSPTTLPALISRQALAFVVDKSIGVASSITIPLFKSLTCGFSPEGQLWFLRIFSDPSESEMIYGYATAHHSAGFEAFKKNFRRAFEGAILKHHYDRSLDITHIANRIAGTSKTHQWKQYVACNHEDALIPDVEVRAVPLSYFHSFFLACAVVWAIALSIHLLQIIYAKKTTGIRGRRVPVRRQLIRFTR